MNALYAWRHMLTTIEYRGLWYRVEDVRPPHGLDHQQGICFNLRSTMSRKSRSQGTEDEDNTSQARRDPSWACWALHVGYPASVLALFLTHSSQECTVSRFLPFLALL